MSTPRKELSTEKKEIILQLCGDGMKQTELARALWIPTPTICRDGMKQTEVARALGIPTPTICRDGMKQTELARALGIPTPTICRFLKRYRESGSLENKRRSGRPKKKLLTAVL